MAGLVPAIHAGAPQTRVERWRGPLQEPTNAEVLASVACLRALDAPNRVDGRDKHGHDAKPARGTSMMLRTDRNQQLRYKRHPFFWVLPIFKAKRGAGAVFAES
jgi:hypothetical protein